MNAMRDVVTILVADRNRHVRELLRRELSSEYRRVVVAGDGHEVMDAVGGERSIDLLILDLDIPYIDWVSVLERLHAETPPIPVVVHSFRSQGEDEPAMGHVAAFVEKSGDLDHLKAVVDEVLRRFYPDRPPGQPSGVVESEPCTARPRE